MRLSKFKLKMSLLVAVNAGSVYHMIKWMGQANDKLQIIANNQEKFNELQGELDLMPTTQDGYKNFAENGNCEIIEKFNLELSELKQSGDIAPSVLEKYGYASKEEFFQNVDSLYSLGKAGNLEAQQAFNQHMLDYQNAPFSQACINVRATFQEVLNAFNPSEFGLNFFDALMTVPTATVGIVATIVCALTSGVTLKVLKDKMESKHKNPNLMKAE